MATIDDQIAGLEQAIADGVKRVVFRDGGTHEEIEYQSLKEMRETLAALKAQRSPKPRIILASF